ncbi:FEL protein, partial [Atractosteus spatula]|nr:FEL protein [Atractosteus spatula]
ALQCRAVPGGLKQMDAGAGRVCGVDNADNLVSYQGNSWVSLAMKGKHVNVASLVFKWLQGRWIQVQPGSLIQIDAGGDKLVVGVNVANSIWCLNSGPVLQYAGQGNIPWIPVVGSLKYYSCGPFGCWGVNRMDQIFVKLDVSVDSCKGSDKWYPIQGSMSLVEVGSDGSVYGVNGVVFKRLGIDACNPFGRRWWALRAAGVARHVSYDRGIVWIVCKDGRVQRCQV